MTGMKRVYLLGLAFYSAACAWAQQPPLLKEYVRLGGQTLAIVERPKQYFPDVPETAPYYGVTGVLRVRSVALGYLDGTYGPSNQLTRAEMAVFLVRAARSAKGLTPDPQVGEYQIAPGYFSDVPYGHWAYAHVQTLKEMGVTNGCMVGFFCPDNMTTHAEMATFTGRAMQYLKTQNGMDPLPAKYSNPALQCFTDAVPGAFYYPYAQMIGEMGVLNKTCGASILPVSPSIFITRGDAAFYLARGILGEMDY